MLSNENYNRFKKLTTKQFNVKNCSCGETVSVRVCILNYLLHAVLQLFKNSWGRAPQAVESRNAGMLCRKGTLLDPTVGLGMPLSRKISDF